MFLRQGRCAFSTGAMAGLACHDGVLGVDLNHITGGCRCLVDLPFAWESPAHR